MTARRLALVIGLALGLSVGSTTARAEPLSYPGDSDNYAWVVTAYYDHGGVTDWNCGGNTYGGHRGTDFAIIGQWQAMAEGRPVLAAAAGTVEATHDGEFDMCDNGGCGGGGGWGNHIRIAHPDGARTVYAHLKKWSVSVSQGEEVACGQQIGLVGSSGNSTGPHLHFEYWSTPSNSSRRDPFAGGCSPWPGYWIQQGGYQSLPAIMCPDIVTPWPRFSLDGTVRELEGQDPNFNNAGPSEGIFDLFEGQEVTQVLTVTNSPDDGEVAQGVRVGIELSPHWLVSDWVILDNWPQNACGGDWCPNDANDLPENLPPAQLGSAFELTLAAMSPGESKRIELTLEATAPTGVDEHAHTGFFVAHAEGVYDKAFFDAEPNNVDGQQTWGGGDLKLPLEVDIWPDGVGSSGGMPTTGGWNPSSTGGDSDGATGSAPETAGWSGGDTDVADSETAGPALPPGYGQEPGDGCGCRGDAEGDGAPWLVLAALLVPRNRRRRTLR